MAELVSRRVLAERRRVRDRLLHELHEIDRRNTDDRPVHEIALMLSKMAASLEGEVLIRVYCMMQNTCNAYEDIAVRVEDPQRSTPHTMLCAVHANPKD